MPAKKPEKQVMDVSKPGKTAPSTSAKPVIVGHRPIVQDPMVTTDTSAEIENPDAEKEAAAPSPSAAKKVIAPIGEQATANQLEKEVATAENSQETPEPAEKEIPEKSSANESTDAAVVDAVIDQVDAKPKEDELSQEEVKKQEVIQKLIADKKYFVPIGKSSRKSKHAVLIVTLLLLFILVGLLAAIDAGILEAGFGLPFDIIK